MLAPRRMFEWTFGAMKLMPPLRFALSSPRFRKSSLDDGDPTLT